MLDTIYEDLAELVATRVEEGLRQRGSIIVSEFLTPSEAAIFLSSNVRTLENWRIRGNVGPAFTRVGTRTVRYNINDLRTFMSERRIKAGDVG